MVKTFKLLLVFLILLGSSFQSSLVYAQCAANEVDTDIGCLPKDDPVGLTARLYSYGLGLIGMIALLSIIYGGYTILTSQGDPGQLQKGKSYIVYAIIGLVLAVGGYAFYRTIGADVLQIPGFE